MARQEPGGVAARSRWWARLAAGGAAAVVALLTVLGGPAAVAQTYGSGNLTLSVANPPPGTPVDLTETGFKPGSPVDNTIASSPISLGTATADAAGVARLTVTIPASLAAGSTHTITASGVAPDGSPLALSATITLGVGSSPAPLVVTGARVAQTVGAGALLVALGAMMVTYVRRLRS